MSCISMTCVRNRCPLICSFRCKTFKSLKLGFTFFFFFSSPISCLSHPRLFVDGNEQVQFSLPIIIAPRFIMICHVRWVYQMLPLLLCTSDKTRLFLCVPQPGTVPHPAAAFVSVTVVPSSCSRFTLWFLTRSLLCLV